MNEHALSSPGKSCVICGKESQPTYDPFCSQRCRDVDLNRWLSGSYTIAGDEEPEDNE